MVEGADDRPSQGWRLHRRQLLGGGLLGAAGAALAPLVSPGARSGGPAAAQPASDVLPAGSTNGGTDQPRAPDALRTAGLAAPLGLGVDDVFLSWQLRDPRRGARQQAYRVVVSGPVVGPGPAPVVWDSGKVVSSDQASVPYAGSPLAPDSAYRWTVQTWDASGRAGPNSAVATFETGLAAEGWTASWIRRVESETGEPDQYTYARREFLLGAGTIDRARAYVSGDQQYELYVNGERVGKGQAYSYPDSMYYEALDLTRAAPSRFGQRRGHPVQLAGPDQGPSGRRRPGSWPRSSSTAGTGAPSGWSPTGRGGWPRGPGSRVPSGTSRATWSTSRRTSTVRPNRSAGTGRASTTAAGPRPWCWAVRPPRPGPTWSRCGPASSRSRCRRSPSPPCRRGPWWPTSGRSTPPCPRSGSTAAWPAAW